MKHFFLFLSLLMCLAGCTSSNVKKDASDMRMERPTFRIAQFTDIHWEHGRADAAAIREMILAAVAAEEPDVCILTGDIVTGGDPRAGWQDIADIMESAGKPYVVLMGNHDPEQWEKDSIYGFLKATAPHHVGNSILEKIGDNYSGVLKIGRTDSDSLAFAIYCLDSGNHYADPLLSDYDNIHLDQILWYADKSSQLRANNGGAAVPALAFFHICVPEYEQLAADKDKYYGHFSEVCCPSEINSGFFSASLEQGDIMGMFVGHDHGNDFIGLWKGIALAYGRQSGVIVSDRFPMGCRIIELREGEHAFDTWIWTPDGEQQRFFYPTGITDEMEQQWDYLPAMEVNDEELQPGIHYIYVEGQGGEKSIDAMFAQGTLTDEGIMSSVDITAAPAEDHFGYLFEGYFLAETTGVYIFSMMSDDGSRLLIDGKCVIDLDGSHSAQPESGYVALDKGLHTIAIQYFEDYMGQQLDVWLTTRNSPKEPLPARLLFTKK